MILRLNMQSLEATDRQHIKEKPSLTMEATVSMVHRNCLSSSESSLGRLAELKCCDLYPVITTLRLFIAAGLGSTH